MKKGTVNSLNSTGSKFESPFNYRAKQKKVQISIVGCFLSIKFLCFIIYPLTNWTSPTME